MPPVKEEIQNKDEKDNREKKGQSRILGKRVDLDEAVPCITENKLR